MFLKRCSECKQWKAKKEFNKNRCRKDGLQDYCKQCRTEYRKIHKKEIADYAHKYHQENREQELERMREYKKTHKEEQRKRDSQKRGLGYNPLNKWFEGSVMHHIDNESVIFIPDKIHRRFNGRGHTLEQHRDKILEYYGSLKRMVSNNPITEEAS